MPTEGGMIRAKPVGSELFAFLRVANPIILGMAGFHLTELKFSYDMKASTLRPSFEGILMNSSNSRSSFLSDCKTPTSLFVSVLVKLCNTPNWVALLWILSGCSKLLA